MRDDDTMKPKVDAGEDTRTFEMELRSRSGGETQKRTISLWVDVGSLEDLRDDPEHPIDILGKPQLLVDLFQQQFEFARVIYMMSDAHDMEPRDFARGLLGSSISDAAEALRQAFRCFFLHLRMLTHVEVLDTVPSVTWDTQTALVEAARKAGVSQRISETLRSDNFVSNVSDAIDSGIANEVDKMFGERSTEPSGDSASDETDTGG